MKSWISPIQYKEDLQHFTSLTFNFRTPIYFLSVYLVLFSTMTSFASCGDNLKIKQTIVILLSCWGLTNNPLW